MDDVFERSKAFGLGEALRRGSAEVNVFKDALTKICAAAKSRGIRVLIDAEDTRRQLTIDHVALSIMPIFNKGDHAVVLNTYQMYLKAGVSKLVAHLHHSIENNYVLGVKMVRGAYIHSEPDRDLLHDTKADTDAEYDQAVRLLVGSNGASLADENGAGATWSADLMLATHNTHSAREALRLYRERFLTRGIGPAAHGAGLRSLAFAQLKGMADELSFKLTEEIESMSAEASGTALEAEPDVARRLPGIGVYKYSIWGTFQECLLYMLRRAEENKDAAARSRTTALAIVREMGRRVLPFTRS
ncbi:proline oxidase PrnD [Purpureocillium lilacinum]|uniref:Proline dehydrogenase n=2 Tax=Purpureocillium lilacinum TaxID=33203 RepID=A0A179H9L8_PURLI|nr:proline oxidase PrnD [Purpureocillium lilacinum]